MSRYIVVERVGELLAKDSAQALALIRSHTVRRSKMTDVANLAAIRADGFLLSETGLESTDTSKCITVQSGTEVERSEIDKNTYCMGTMALVDPIYFLRPVIT